MPNIFEKRINLKPYEYPNLAEFKNAIRHAYWIHTEFESEFNSDIQDYKTKLSLLEQTVVKRAMLAISQIEVSVKTFWADIYKRMPKPEIADVGYVFAECYIEGTEIMTPKGWVDLREITVDHMVAQFNTDNRKLEFVNPIKTTREYYKGLMYKFSKKNFETVVTPNHRMFTFTPSGNPHFENAETFRDSFNGRRLVEAGKINNEGLKELSFIDRLRIAIQADGNKRYYRKSNGERAERGSRRGGVDYHIRISKQRKKERLRWILNNTPEVHYSIRSYPSRPEVETFTINIDNRYNYKYFDWVNLEDKTAEWCEEFVQELAEWDGTRHPTKKDKLITYSTVEKSVADIVQAVGVCAGYRCHMGVKPDNRKDSYKDLYIVGFTANRETVSTTPIKKENFEYEGEILCITVPSGVILTRYKNNTFIGGNSETRHSDAYSHLLELLSLNEEFEHITEVGPIKDRIDYLNKYLEGYKSNGSDQAYSMSLLLFSLFVEHISLFSQFLILMSFNRKKSLLKGISNAVEATSKEEQIHGDFGIELIKIIRNENPSWFDENFNERVKKACQKAYKAEHKILDWIFERGELDFLSRKEIEEFLKDRFNKSLQAVEVDPIFEVDTSSLEKTSWFDEEILSSSHVDFFHKRPTSYSKKNKSFSAGDLF